MSFKKKLRKQSGFSLIELLVVIFIIGVLAGVVFPNFMGARERARDARRKQDLGDIKNALRLYYNDSQGYPTPGDSYGLDLEEEYIKQMPIDPLGGSYNYNSSSPYDEFVIWAYLENGADQDVGESQESCGFPDPTPSVYMNCGG